jgi:hypothetical protein
MPNRAGKVATRSRKSKAAETDLLGNLSDSLTDHNKDKEANNVSTSTDTNTENGVPDFTSLIQAAPEDYKPDRSPAGRTRTPSQFEAVLPSLKDKPYQRIPHDGNVEQEETESGRIKYVAKAGTVAHVIKRELQKAQHHLGYGMDLHFTPEFVEFRVRDLQKKEVNDPEASGAEADSDSDNDGNDEE